MERKDEVDKYSHMAKYNVRDDMVVSWARWNYFEFVCETDLALGHSASTFVQNDGMQRSNRAILYTSIIYPHLDTYIHIDRYILLHAVTIPCRLVLSSSFEIVSASSIKKKKKNNRRKLKKNKKYFLCKRIQLRLRICFIFLFSSLSVSLLFPLGFLSWIYFPLILF